MRAIPLIALLGACAGEGRQIESACARTGVCVDIAAGSTTIEGIAPLAPAHLFGKPVASAEAISSTFGPRWKLSDGRYDFHLGIDYFDTVGTPLLAIGPGVVSGVYRFSPVFPNAGNVIVVEHAIPARTFHQMDVDRFFAVYLHANTADVSEGQIVGTGEQLGTMGMTGDTEFVHLHFETRVETVCSLQFQIEHPDECQTGFDPHVHPFLFVGGANLDQVAVEEIDPIDGAAFAVRLTATRGDLDLDTIETDLGTIGFNARRGIDARSLATLDDFHYPWVHIVPLEFVSASDQIAYELHFAAHPAFLELRDIYGRGLRFGQRL